jgi:transporter family-2 protein
MIIGAIISIMILLNGVLSGNFNPFASVIIIHMVGLLSITMVLFLSRPKLNLKRGLPLYLYSAGAIGVFTILFNNISFDELGVSLTLALGLLGQTVISIIIDHFGWLGLKRIKFDHKKWIGLIMISVGIFIMTMY